MNLLIVSILFSLMILSVYFLADRFLKSRLKISEIFKNTKVQVLLVILWTFIGFFAGLDYSRQCGDIISYSSVLNFENILYSSISLLLLLASISSKKTFNGFFVSETLYWLFKLFILKGGYSTGWGINPIIFSFDFIGLLLRIWIITNAVLNLKIKVFILPLVSVILIIAKSIFFTCQDDFIYEKIIMPYLSGRLVGKIEGKWEGTATWEIRLVNRTLYSSSIHGNSTMKIAQDLIDKLTDRNQVVRKNEPIDSFFMPLNKYKFDDKQFKGQEIYIKQSNINIIFKDNTIQIKGLDYFLDTVYYRKYIVPSFNSIIYFDIYIEENSFETEIVKKWHAQRDKYLEKRKFIELYLRIKYLGKEELIGTLNDIYLIKLKRGK